MAKITLNLNYLTFLAMLISFNFGWGVLRWVAWTIWSDACLLDQITYVIFYNSCRKELLVFFIWQKKKNELWSQKGIPFLKGCLLPNPRKNLWKKFEEKSKIRYYILINCSSWKLNTIEIFWNFWTLLSW